MGKTQENDKVRHNIMTQIPNLLAVATFLLDC